METRYITGTKNKNTLIFSKSYTHVQSYYSVDISSFTTNQEHYQAVKLQEGMILVHRENFKLLLFLALMSTKNSTADFPADSKIPSAL